MARFTSEHHRMTITVKDVAREAGVSRTTVSNVFNGRAKYSRETEEAVLTAAKKLGYKPNLAAQSLITNKSQLVGLILPSYVDAHTLTNSPFYNIIIDGVYSVLRDEAYYDVIISCVPNDQALTEVSDWADARNVDGLIAIGQYDAAFLKSLEAKQIPVVLIDNYQRQVPAFSYINSDDETGGYLATRKLIDSGYQKIALCSISPHSPLMQKRYVGYQQAMREVGYAEHYIEGDTLKSPFEEGKRLGEALIEQQMDAVFCTEDMLAVGVLHTLMRRGIQVGPEFGLVGFDNIPVSRHIFPELTTIDQNIAEKGETATRTLINVLKQDSLKGTRLILPVTLIERDTTRR